MITKYKSPHYRKIRLSKIDSVVIHYLSAVNIDKDNPFDIDKILKLLIKPIPISKTKSVKVSAHYLISRNGTLYQLVKDENVAWHSGISKMPNGRNIRNSVNDFSIGIELVGGKWIDFTKAQYKSLKTLLKNLIKKYDVKEENILGHCDVAPKRKIDPGKYFNWDIIAELYKKEIDKLPEIKIEKPIEPIIEEHKKLVNDITDGMDEIEQSSESQNKDIFFIISEIFMNILKMLKYK